MALGPHQQDLGITPAKSLAYPNQGDIDRTNALKRTLESHGVFESESELRHREEVVGQLNQLVKQWIKDLSMTKGMVPIIAEAVGGGILTFGSYKLGVHDKDSGINILCVTPQHIHRGDFFS